MNDVLTVALERQRELHDEIAEIDEFIRQAESLLSRAKTRTGQPGPRRVDQPADRPEPAAEARPAAEPARDRPGERQGERQGDRQGGAATAESLDAEQDTGIRKFPWTGQQPAVRRTGGEEPVGPTRRNVFRRDMSAAG